MYSASKFAFLIIYLTDTPATIYPEWNIAKKKANLKDRFGQNLHTTNILQSSSYRIKRLKSRNGIGESYHIFRAPSVVLRGKRLDSRPQNSVQLQTRNDAVDQSQDTTRNQASLARCVISPSPSQSASSSSSSAVHTPPEYRSPSCATTGYSVAVCPKKGSFAACVFPSAIHKSKSIRSPRIVLSFVLNRFTSLDENIPHQEISLPHSPHSVCVCAYITHLLTRERQAKSPCVVFVVCVSGFCLFFIWD